MRGALPYVAALLVAIVFAYLILPAVYGLAALLVEGLCYMLVSAM